MIFSLLEFAIGRKESDGKLTGYLDVLSIETKNHGWWSLLYIGNIDDEGKMRFDILWLRGLFALLDK